MTSLRPLTVLCYLLAVAIWFQFTLTSPLQAEEAAKQDKVEEKAVEKEAEQKEEARKQEPKAEAQEQEQAPAAPKVVIKKRAPLYELPVLKPKQLTKKVQRIAPVPTKQPEVQQKPAPRQLPVNQRPNLPFWSPRQAGLSSAATYQLNSLGRHVHLNPATQWRLNRANAAAGQQISPAATVTGQGAEKFYPGVTRLPPQKPFANVEPEPTGLQRYWPLLLEGRQDPNTGLIIWTLP